jgi:transcriptional regulator GlxA family with amidase domain
VTYYSKLPPSEVPPKLIGFVGFDGMTTLDLTGPLEAFAAARSDSGELCYETVLISVNGSSFVASSGATFKAHCTLATAPVLDTIVIPGSSGLRLGETSHAIATWLRERAAVTRRIASVSAGIYPLAESGLLDGRRATTHWRLAQHVASTFRAVHVSDTGSFVRDGNFYTCGGGSAPLEMTLALIQEDCGARVALRLARELVVSLRPAGGDDRQLAPMQHERGPEERLEELPAWITSQLRSRLSVEVLAERACVCPRHFSRIFKRKYHVTPAEFVEHLRMAEAARRLTSRSTSIEEVADSVGYKTADVFRRAFERRYGMPPKRFQKLGRETAASKPSPHSRRQLVRKTARA